MSTPTVPVTVTLESQEGAPYPGITVRARLDINEVYQGFVISDQAEAVTDVHGVAVLNCFPNAPSPTGLGTQGSAYRFWATIPGGRSLNVDAVVPNTACRLENIMVSGDEPPALTDAQLAVFQAQSAATTAGTKAAAAEASANAAAGSITAAQTAAANALASQNATSAIAASVAFLYQGTYTTPPTTRPDGSPIQNGDRYPNSADGYEYIRIGGAWTSSQAAVDAKVQLAGFNFDGGTPTSNYGGIAALDGGTP